MKFGFYLRIWRGIVGVLAIFLGSVEFFGCLMLGEVR